MISKPDAKPLVSGWLNPLANDRLTLKQNKTKQKEVGFGSRTKTKTHRTRLPVNPTSEVPFLASSFARRFAKSRRARAKNDFQQVFNNVFNSSQERSRRACRRSTSTGSPSIGARYA